MRFAVYRTLLRGVKIQESGIKKTRNYSNVIIDRDHLSGYREFFGFPQELPFSYLYILSQRAQVALMLEPDYTIPLPGMIHLSNEVKVHRQIDLNTPIDIQTMISVEYKETGSLLPRSNVEFFQNDKKMATSISGYLVKRKTKSKKDHLAKKSKPQLKIPRISKSVLTEIWELPRNMGKEYAKISGDRNPIHTSKLFAKFAGFKRPIIHGWYSASRVLLESHKILTNPNELSVNFVKPILLPSSVQLDFEEIDKTEGSVNYVVSTPQQGIIHLYGSLKISN